jgi:hypothetical protein
MLGVTTGRYFDFISRARLPRTIRHLSVPRAVPLPVDSFDSNPDSLPLGTSHRYNFQAALADDGRDYKSRLLIGRQLGRAPYSADLMHTESARTNALGGMRGKSLNAGREK